MVENTSWPGWETVGLIGRGSFGAVYKIQRDLFGETEYAALKVISIPQNEGDIDELYNDGYDEESITSTFQSHLKSIVAEYSLMRKMSGCPNIVNCDDLRYVQHNDGIGWDIFIKMELLTPLAKALPAHIPEETVIHIAKDMCASLEICKKHGVIHRDIKPQNIFLSPDGYYKLGDFGIAKTVEKTMGGTKIGTYKYMAPEVYNNQPYGTSADIYSLGLVLYWMLNERRMPFLPLPPEKLKAGMEEEARSRRLAGDSLPPPAHGSEKLKRIVLKACAYDPKDRYAAAVDMLHDLVRISGSAYPIYEPAHTASAPVEAKHEKTEAEKPLLSPSEPLKPYIEPEQDLPKKSKLRTNQDDAWEFLLSERECSDKASLKKQTNEKVSSVNQKPLSKKDEAWAVLLGDRESLLASQPAQQKTPDSGFKNPKSILHSVKAAVQEWYTSAPEKQSSSSSVSSSGTSTAHSREGKTGRWDDISRLYQERDALEAREKQWELQASLSQNSNKKES